MNIYKIYDIDNLGNINIKKPIVHSDKYTVFDLFIEKYSSVLICTSKLQINYINNQAICLKDNNNFIEKLDILLNNIKNRLIKNENYKDIFLKKKYHSLIYNNSLKINNISQKDICVYNLEGSKISYDSLLCCDNIACILYIKNCWLNDNRFGFTIKISQIQRKEPLNLSSNLFMKSTSSSSSLPPPPPPPPPPISLNKRTNNFNKRTIFINKNEQTDTEKYPNTIVRPSLHEILRSKNKLRKTNNL